MKIPTRTRYGMRAMVELAAGYPDRPISLRFVADKQSIPIKYLEQLMVPLKAAGYLRSVRGLHGGYIFANPPEETSIYDVYVALEGPTALVDCVSDSDLCNDCDRCPTRDVWVRMSDVMKEILTNQSIADLRLKMLEKEKMADSQPGDQSADSQPNEQSVDSRAIEPSE